MRGKFALLIEHPAMEPQEFINALPASLRGMADLIEKGQTPNNGSGVCAENQTRLRWDLSIKETNQ